MAYEFLNFSNYCGVCDHLNKLVIFAVKSGIDLKYQLANGSEVGVIGERLEGCVWIHSEAIKMRVIGAQRWAESDNSSTGYDG